MTRCDYENVEAFEKVVFICLKFPLAIERFFKMNMCVQ